MDTGELNIEAQIKKNMFFICYMCAHYDFWSVNFLQKKKIIFMNRFFRILATCRSIYTDVSEERRNICNELRHVTTQILLLILTSVRT
jgi:hypothetical protein